MLRACRRTVLASNSFCKGSGKWGCSLINLGLARLIHTQCWQAALSARGQASGGAGVRCWKVGVDVCERSGKCGCRRTVLASGGVCARGQASAGAGKWGCRRTVLASGGGCVGEVRQVRVQGSGKWGCRRTVLASGGGCVRKVRQVRVQASGRAGVRCWQVGVGVCERSGKCGCRGQASGGAGVRCWQATLSARGQASGDVV